MCINVKAHYYEKTVLVRILMGLQYYDKWPVRHKMQKTESCCPNIQEMSVLHHKAAINDSIWFWYVLRNIKIAFKTVMQPGEIPGQTKRCRAPSPDMPNRRDSGSVKYSGNTTAGINDSVSKLRCLCCSLQWRGGIFICTSWPADPSNPTVHWMVELWSRRGNARWAYMHFLFPVKILL